MDSQGNPKLILYRYRWVVLLCFGMAQASVGMVSGTCATTASIIKEVYGLSLF
jgi:MFS family permease